MVECAFDGSFTFSKADHDTALQYLTRARVAQARLEVSKARTARTPGSMLITDACRSHLVIRHALRNREDSVARKKSRDRALLAPSTAKLAFPHPPQSRPPYLSSNTDQRTVSTRRIASRCGRAEKAKSGGCTSERRAILHKDSRHRDCQRESCDARAASDTCHRDGRDPSGC